ncbi:MAG: DUF2520 domain-containing protein [Rikenellaceae bacterium]
MKKVVIVGGGNLAESVAVAVAGSTELCLQQIYLRNAERGAVLSTLTDAPFATFEQELACADIYLLAVSDSAIGELSRKLHFAPGAVVAHTAGSSSIEVIDPTLRRAVLYPMQSFSQGRRVDFGVIPIFVESSDEQTLIEVEEVAQQLSNTVVRLNSEERRRLHLSAVFVCNFINAMFTAGEELVGESRLPFEILKPLIEECCAKACCANSPREVQTGPAARGDFATIEKHTSMLDGKPELREIYQNISKYIWETSKKI